MKYILDTSVLVTNPNIIHNFPNNEVIVPIVVINELDKLKKNTNEAGKNARICIKMIDDICNVELDITTGILLDNQTLFRIDCTYFNENNSNISQYGDVNYADNQILMLGNLLYNNGVEEVTIVSNDLNLRIKAKSLGLNTLECKGKITTLNDLYSGIVEVTDNFLRDQLKESDILMADECTYELLPNQFIVFKGNKENTAIGRKLDDGNVALVKQQYPWNVKARNPEQACALDLLLDREVDLVTLLGHSGTGKTILALSTIMDQIIVNKVYKKCIIYKPVESVGKELGYLPGSIDEKIEPYFENIMDNFEVLLGKNKQWKKDLDMWRHNERITFEAIAYVRGRSITNSLIMIDEAQNLSVNELKTVLTRAGEGTKIILTGDIYQIDNKSLDAINNGLVNVVESFKGDKNFGHILLTKGERSRLAEKAAKLL